MKITKNPLEKIYDEINTLNEAIGNKTADLFFGVFSARAREDTTAQLEALRANLNLLESKKVIIENFYKRAEEIKLSNREERLLTLPSYHYFNNTLKPIEFMYARGEPCDFCGKTKTSRTGVVFTFDPLTGDLAYICDYCHITRKEESLKKRETES